MWQILEIFVLVGVPVLCAVELVLFYFAFKKDKKKIDNLIILFKRTNRKQNNINKSIINKLDSITDRLTNIEGRLTQVESKIEVTEKVFSKKKRKENAINDIEKLKNEFIEHTSKYIPADEYLPIYISVKCNFFSQFVSAVMERGIINFTEIEINTLIDTIMFQIEAISDKMFSADFIKKIRTDSRLQIDNLRCDLGKLIEERINEKNTAFFTIFYSFVRKNLTFIVQMRISMLTKLPFKPEYTNDEILTYLPELFAKLNWTDLRAAIMGYDYTLYTELTDAMTKTHVENLLTDHARRTNKLQHLYNTLNDYVLSAG